jgi:hypothetical protein
MKRSAATSSAPRHDGVVDDSAAKASLGQRLGNSVTLPGEVVGFAPMLQLAAAAAAKVATGWLYARRTWREQFGNLGAVSGDVGAHVFAWQAKRHVDNPAPALRQSVATSANGRDFKRLLNRCGNRLRLSCARRTPSNRPIYALHALFRFTLLFCG